MSARNASGAPTPPQEEQPNGAFATYVPHDLKHNADFENALMRVVLGAQQPKDGDGIRVIPVDSTEIPVEGISVRAQDISLQSLPIITEDELPLPLEDPRRIFASPIPGVKLTHPGGYIEGGPGLDPEMDTFPEDFLTNNSQVTSPAELHAAIAKEIEASMDLLRERLRAREQAIARNEQIEKDLRRMADEHGMELKVNKKLADERRAKKEAKERRRAERGAA